jgi:hypothetical protein
MWIFTPIGFFSAVVRESDTEQVKVRARCRVHLENLVEAIRPMCPRGTDLTIYDTPNRDYCCRVFVPRESWAKMCSEFAEEVEYPNFKDECYNHEHPKGYMNALHDVWSVMFSFQHRHEKDKG